MVCMFLKTEQSAKDNGNTMILTGWDLKNWQMVNFIKVCLKTVRRMDKDLNNLQTDQPIKGNGKEANCMEMVIIVGLMETSMLVNGKIIL